MRVDEDRVKIDWSQVARELDFLNGDLTEFKKGRRYALFCIRLFGEIGQGFTRVLPPMQSAVSRGLMWSLGVVDTLFPSSVAII